MLAVLLWFTNKKIWAPHKAQARLSGRDGDDRRGRSVVPPSPRAGRDVARVPGVFPDASTSPALVETADGGRWVLKFSGAGPGPFGLLIEFLALGIARAFGAPVPDARRCGCPRASRGQAGTDEFDAHAAAERRLEPRDRLRAR